MVCVESIHYSIGPSYCYWNSSFNKENSYQVIKYMLWAHFVLLVFQSTQRCPDITVNLKMFIKSFDDLNKKVEHFRSNNLVKLYL